MATEPIKISGMTQAQRNAIIAALGCKTVHRMNNGDSLPVGFEPDELIINTGVFETNTLDIAVPTGYVVDDAILTTIGEGLEPYNCIIIQGGADILQNTGDFNNTRISRFVKQESYISGGDYSVSVIITDNGTGGCSLTLFCKKRD